MRGLPAAPAHSQQPGRPAGVGGGGSCGETLCPPLPLLQAGQVVNEYELLPLDSSGGSRRPLEEALTALRKVRPPVYRWLATGSPVSPPLLPPSATFNSSSTWSPLTSMSAACNLLHPRTCTHHHCVGRAAAEARAARQTQGALFPSHRLRLPAALALSLGLSQAGPPVQGYRGCGGAGQRGV